MSRELFPGLDSELFPDEVLGSAVVSDQPVPRCETCAKVVSLLERILKELKA